MIHSWWLAEDPNRSDLLLPRCLCRLRKCAAASIGSVLHSLSSPSSRRQAAGNRRRRHLGALPTAAPPRAAHAPNAGAAPRPRSRPPPARFGWDFGGRSRSRPTEGERCAWGRNRNRQGAEILGHWALLGHRGTRKEPRACLEFSSTYRVKSEKHPPKQRSQD